MEFKKCKHCGEEKPRTHEFFIRHKLCRDQIGPACRPCYRAIQKKWRDDNAEYIRQDKRRQYHASGAAAGVRARAEKRRLLMPLMMRVLILRRGVKIRSIENGWPVPEWITTKFVKEWLESSPNCPCCGVVFNLMGTKKGRMDESPSFDRLDSKKEYTLENTRLICWRCNNIKRNYEPHDLRMVADWIDAQT